MTMVRRLCLVAFLVGAAVLAVSGVAGAHALLKNSTPAAGADLAEAPHRILMTFTEPPDPTLSLATLVTFSGATVRTGKVQAVAGEPTELQLAVPAIPDGVYTVTWRTVSKTDGHVTGGSFAFGIDTAAPTGTPSSSGSGSSSPTALALAARWLLFAGVALLLGGAAVRLIVRLTPSPGAVRVLLIAGWSAALVGTLAAFLAESHVTGASFTELAKTSAGRTYVMLGVALLALAAVGVGVIRRASRGWWCSLGALAVVAMFIQSLGSHADNPSRWRWFNLGVELTHLVAVGIWIGGLVWLFAALRTDHDADAPERRAGVVRFSTMAAVALAFVAASGLGRALDELNGLHSLLSTSFGQTLIVKTGLFAVLLAFGAYNHYRIVPRIRSGSGTNALRRSVRVELLVAAATIFAGVLLSQLPPASYAPSVPTNSAQPVVVTGSDFGTTVHLRLQVAPGTIGSNTFDAQVTDFDTGAVVSARSLVLTFTLPADPDLSASTLSLKPEGTHWRGTGSNLSVTGTWSVVAVVQATTGAVSVPMKVTPRLPLELITSIPGPAGQSTIYTITLGGGYSVQTYVDPQKAGPAAVHFTFFQSSGKEQPIRSASATQTGPSGATSSMKLIRFDPGHFAANTHLNAGHWTFTIQAVTMTGIPLSAYFSEMIG
jgi:copper transport protein